MGWEQKSGPRDYRWDEVEIDLKSAGSYLQLTAEKIVREGIGDVPEYPLNVLLVDTVIISNRKDIVINRRSSDYTNKRIVIPGSKTEVLRDNSAAKKRNHVWLAADPEEIERVSLINKSVSEVGAVTPVPLSGNRVRGGGFDVALNPFWFIHTSTGYFADKGLLDTENPADGRAALRLRGASSPTHTRSPLKALLLSAPIMLMPGDYTCSFKVRTDDENALCNVTVAEYMPDTAVLKKGKVFAVKSKIKPGKKWSLISFTFKAEKAVNAQIHFAAQKFSGKPDKRDLSTGSVWLDSFAIQEGKNTLYKPAAKIEFGLHSSEKRLFYCGDIEFDVEAVAYEKTAYINFEYEVLNLSWQVIAGDKFALKMDKGGFGKTRIKIPFKGKRGAYVLRVQVAGKPETSQVLDFGVIDDPSKNTAKENMGIYASYSEAKADYFKRAGAKYFFSLCATLFRPYKVIPKKVRPAADSVEEVVKAVENAEYKWSDDVVAAWQGKGFEVIPEIIMQQMPKWAKKSPRAFGAFFSKMVKHYSKLGIKRWVTGDEVRSNYIPYHREAMQAIKKNDPDAGAFLSTCPGVIEKYDHEYGIDTMAVGGSYLNAKKWIYYAKAAFVKEKKLPFWTIGVGWGSRPSYLFDPHYIKMNKSRGRFGVITNMLYSQALLNPELFITYCNRFTNGRAFGTGDMYTGTFVPHGVYFTATAAFVRGAEGGGELDLRNVSDLEAFWFKRNGKSVAVICQSQSFWGSPRGEDAFALEIKADADKLGFYNQDLSEIKINSHEKNRISYNLPIMGILMLEDRGLGDKALFEAVRNLQAEKTHSTRYVFMGRKDGGLDLGLWLKNGLEKDLDGSIAVSKRVALQSGARRTRELSLAEGESSLIRFKLAPSMGTVRPIGNLIVKYTYSDNKTFALGGESHLWAACAKYNPE
ncbi:MAG: hypothetical protein ACYTFY_14155, partial [Planctomycetota bacterium]